MANRSKLLSFSYKFLLFSISIFLPQFHLFGQIENKGIPFIRNYTQKDYNAAPQNWSVIQDSRGVMFFGNNYGFLEFDGNNWRLLGISNKTIVRTLAVDKKGKIFVGGQGDFGYLKPDAQGEMSYVSLKPKVHPDYQNFDDVWRLYITDEGVAFCTNAGIYYYKDGKIKVYKPDSGFFNFSFYLNQRFFVTVKEKGIYELKNEKLYLIPNSETLKKASISSILPFGDLEALIVTEEDGIYRYDGYTDFRPWKVNAPEYFKDNKILTACATSDGFALGSSHKGLLMIDKVGNVVQHLDRQKGLQGSTILSLYPDFSGNLWAGLSNGIDYIEINSPFTFINAETGLPGSGYSSFIDNGNLYLGTNDGLYYADWSGKSPHLDSNPFKLVENSLGQVYNIQKINNNLLLSHHLGAFHIKDGGANSISDFLGAWKFLPLRSNPGYVLCGSYYGLSLYKMTNGKIQFITKIDGFSESSRVMEEDDEGNIWVAHGYKGIYRVKLTSDLTKVSKVDFYGKEHGFPSNLFISVFKIGNKLVFTGESGYYKYNKEKNRFEDFEEFNELFPNDRQIRKLIQDNAGNIWFSKGDDIGVFKRKSNGVYDFEKSIYYKLKGKLVGGFEHIAYYDPSNVIIGTAEGFLHFNPSYPHNKNSENTYHTLIRKVEISGEAEDSLLSGGAYLSKDQPSISQPEESIPVLPYESNSLRFTYSAISYEDIEKVQYQYILEGFDRKWSSWTSLRNKEYTKLREGNYVFRVKSRNIYNRESVEASFSFTINPPWYRSYYAYVFYFILGMIVLYLLKKVMERRINNAKLRLKEEQEKAFKLKESQHLEEVLKAEKEIIKLNNEKLENELIHKNRELTSSAMHVMHSRETILKIREQLESALTNVKDKESNFYLKKVIKSIEADVKFDNKWEQFELHFNQIHQDFLKRIKEDFPELTHRDIKLCAYLRMNLSSKEIAPLLNISTRGIEASRYRIRRKMNLDPEVNLTEFILKY